MRRRIAVLVAAFLPGVAACGGAVGYRAPKEGDWSAREVPPRIVALDPAGYASDLVRATQYQIEKCERIAAAYDERARHRVHSGTALTAAASALGGVGVVLVGASQAVDQNSDARLPALWTGVVTGLLGAGLGIWQVTSGTSQADAYNDAATAVRASISDFSSTIRSKDGVAGEPLTRSILEERLCSLKEDCERDQFGVSPLGVGFGDAAGKDDAMEKSVDAICTPNNVVVEPWLKYDGPPKPGN